MTPTPTLATPPTETYSHDRLGYTVAYPDNWTISTGDPTFVELVPGEGGVVQIRGNIGGPTTLETLLLQLLMDFSSVSSFREVAVTPTNNGSPGYLISFEWSSDDRDFRTDYMFTVKGARFYSVAASSVRESYDLHRSGFQEVIDSFETTLAPSVEPIDTGPGIDEILDHIGDKVTQIRGLSSPSELRHEFQTREEFSMMASDALIDDETLRETERLKGLCVVLDLCAPSDDLLQISLSIGREGVLGFYEPEDRVLTLVTGTDEAGPLTWLTYAHEYTHAVQDEEFDLSVIRSEEDTFDSSMAELALIEGDAALTEYLFYETLPPEQQSALAVLLEGRTAEYSNSQEVAQAPRIISETLGWEYDAGLGFAFRLYLENGFDTINAAFDDPPRSTEQIIHPEKYLAGEAPHPVELPDLATALGNNWSLHDTGVLGELLTNVYLDTFLTDQVARDAAEGWGGDRYALLKNDEAETLLALRFSWDTPADAAEFYQAYVDLAAEKGRGQWELAETGQGLQLWVGESISVHLSLEADNTLVVIGPDRATVDAVVDAISGPDVPN